MNVLLTCVGRRNYLVRYFREALAGRGAVIAADASRHAPALYEADRWYVLRPIQDKDYLSQLLDLCQRQSVQLVVPLNDLELPVLAEARKQFQNAGVRILVSSADVVQICFDKWKMYNFLKNNCLPTPTSFLTLESLREASSQGAVSYPLMVKPRWGSASIGVQCVYDEEELNLSYKLSRRQIARSILAKVSSEDFDHCVLIQEFLDGEEFGLDVVNDLDGHYITTMIRKKLGMRSGETDRAITCHDSALEALGKRIGNLLGHVGNLDCDVIRGPHGLGILDMNPRFGGGYPFMHVAGANLPAALLAWASGRQPDTAWFKYQQGVMGGKHDNIAILPY